MAEAQVVGFTSGPGDDRIRDDAGDGKLQRVHLKTIMPNGLPWHFEVPRCLVPVGTVKGKFVTIDIKLVMTTSAEK